MEATCPESSRSTGPAPLRLSGAALVATYAIGLGLALAMETLRQVAAYETAVAEQRAYWPGYFMDSTFWTLMLAALPLFWLARPFLDVLYRVGCWMLRVLGWLGRSDAAFGAVAFLLPVAIGLAVRAHYFGAFAPEDIYIHDEASYLFQANTFLDLRLYYPSPAMAEHFDWFHIINQGKMASRYSPGTGLVLMPFVALGAPWLAHVLGSGVVGLLVFLIGLELGDRRAARLGALLCALAPAVLTFGQILEAHIPTAVWLLVGVLYFLRTLRGPSMRNPALAGVGLGMALLTRPLTAVGLAGLPAAWLVIQVLLGRVPRGWAKLGAMTAPVALSLGLQGLYNAALTGDPLYPPYLLYTDTYSPRHRYGFYNVTRAKQEEARNPQAFARRDLQDKFVDYDRWADDVRPLPDAYYRFFESPLLVARSVGGLPSGPTLTDAFYEPAVPVKKLRMRVMGMCRGVLGTVAGATVLVGLLLSLGRLSRADRLMLAGIFGLHAIHLPFAFEGVDWVGYVFESAPLLCLAAARLAVGLGDWAIQRGRRWLVVWLAMGLAGLTAENHASWLPSRFDEIALTRDYYKGMREHLDRSGVKAPALVFIRPGKRHLHRSLVFNLHGPSEPVLRAWHTDPMSDLFCAMRHRDRRSYLLDEDTGQIRPLVSPR
jgi:hypothetical protein